MRERITIRKAALVGVAFMFAGLLYAYVYVQQFFTRNDAPKLASGDECAPDTSLQQVPKQNPNKMLFISCGGFLE